MNSKNKRLCLCVSLFAISTIVLTSSLLFFNEDTIAFKTNANMDPYSLKMSSFDENKNSDDVLTNNRNPITFTYNGYLKLNDNWGSIVTNGFFKNTTQISGLESITISFVTESKNLSLSYGWFDDDYVVSNITINSSNQTYNFGEEHPSFFKIENNSGSPIEIEHISLTYSCSETSLPDIYSKLSFYLINESTEYSVGASDTSIKNAVIPSIYKGLPVTTIRSQAFNNCYYLSTVNIPDSIQTIGENAFSGCSSLVSLEIPDSVTSIGRYAFAGCSSLKEIAIPEGISSIANYTFQSCSSLHSVVIPDSVTSVGRYSFQGCLSLTSLIIPSRVASIGSNAFAGCFKLVEIINNSSLKLQAGSTSYGYVANYAKQVISDESDSKINIDTKGFVTYVDNDVYLIDYVGKNVNISIPNIVTIMYDYAFYNNTSVISVVIPNSIEAISDNAFACCTSLESVVIPDSVTSIGYDAFYLCSSLTSVVIPDSITSIGNGAFSSCSSLTSVVIPDSITSIANELFAGCTSLSTVVIPNTIVSIGNYSFQYCSSLESIIIPDSVISIGYGAFWSCSSLVSIIIPYTVASISDYVFLECNKLTIYCGAESQPVGWNDNWNPDNRPVVWNYTM